MVRPLERIEQEIATLNQAVAATARELQDANRKYLHALGQATRQQLILASYHICTHGYPEQFLALPVSQRQQLQQDLQQLSKQAQAQILAAMVPLASSEPALLRFTEGAAAIPQGSVELEDRETAPAIPTDESTSPAADFYSTAAADAPDPELPAAASPDSPDSPEASRAQIPTTPSDVIEWQEELEEKIIEILQALSHRANRLLQDAELLPPQLPEPVLEVAAKADLDSETTASPPNLLNLLIETGSETEKEPLMTPLIAIRLRLSEIEFGDAATTAWRSKLRNLLAQLTKLGRDYQRKQKERSIAQAEAAWRSTWYEAEK